MGKDGGQVGVSGKGRSKSNVEATVGVTEYGGLIGVANKNGEPRAGMNVDAYGKGVVNTWDKNGYRLGTLD